MGQSQGPDGGHLHLKEIGWQADFQEGEEEELIGLIDQEGNQWRFNHEISWHDYEEQVNEEREKQLWKKASAHRGVQGMEQGIDLTVSTRHYNRLVKEGKTDKAAALMSIETGALWSPARMEEAGIPHETGASEHKCPLCGAANVD